MSPDCECGHNGGAHSTGAPFPCLECTCRGYSDPRSTEALRVAFRAVVESGGAAPDVAHAAKAMADDIDANILAVYRPARDPFAMQREHLEARRGEAANRASRAIAEENPPSPRGSLSDVVARIYGAGLGAASKALRG